MHSTKIPLWKRWTLGLGILVICCIPLFYALEDAPVFGDETLYLRVAAKTLQTGRWVPILGRPYAFVEKPPLTVWGAAAGMGLAGVGELGARWANGLVALLLCAVSARFALRFGNLWTMAMAPLLLVTSPGLLLAHGLRSVVPEAWLLLAVTAAFYWYLASDARSPWFHYGGLVLLSVFAGWTKGLVGPVLVGAALFVVELVVPRRAPAAAADPARCVTARPADSPVVRLRRALLTAAAATLPGILSYLAWLLFSLGTVEAMSAFLNRDLVVRAAGGRDSIDLQPFSIYLRAAWENFGLLAVLGPLTLVGMLVRDLFRPGDEPSPGRRVSLTLLLWIALVVALFGIPKSRHPWYSFPAYPALALAAAFALDRLRRGMQAGRSGRGLKAATAAFGLLLAVLFAARADALRRSWPAWDPHSLLALQRLLDADPAAQAYAESGLAQGEYARTHVVEWQRFYLRRFAEIGQRELPADAPACSFVVTAEPEAWRPLLGARLAGATPVPPGVPGWLPLFVLDLCGGRFAGGAA